MSDNKSFKNGERYTDEELLAMVPDDLRNSPHWRAGFAEGIRLREAFRAKHGRLPELGECE